MLGLAVWKVFWDWVKFFLICVLVVLIFAGSMQQCLKFFSGIAFSGFFFFSVWGKVLELLQQKRKCDGTIFGLLLKYAKQEWLLQLFTAKAAQLNEPIKVALIARNLAPGKHNWFWFVRWLVEWFSNDYRKWFLWFWVYLVLSLSLKIVITTLIRNKRGVGVGFQR